MLNVNYHFNGAIDDINIYKRVLDASEILNLCNDTFPSFQMCNLNSDFSYSNTCENDSTQFTDLSTDTNANIINWQWYFGDGDSIVGVENPVHLYASAGTYNAILSVTNDSNCVDSITIPVTINPVYNINVTNSICQGDSILLGGVFQHSNGIYIDSLQTNFGCDSIVATTLTLNPIFNTPLNQTICQGDSVLFGNVFQHSNGIYTDSLQSEFGCDSLILTTLTVNPSYNLIQSQMICQGDSFLFEGMYYNTTGIYSDTMQTAMGCDSILNLDLVVNPLFNIIQNQSICQGDSILLGGAFQNSNGIYTDSLQSEFGCDSIVITTLTLNMTFNITQNQTICQGDSILLGGVFQHSNGVYIDSLQTDFGCDSIVATTLTLNPIFNTPLNQTICEGDSILLEGGFQNMNGVYTDSLQTILGCDSLILTTLTVNPSYNLIQSQMICQGDSFLFEGMYYNTTGIYSDTMQTVMGCDSILNLDLVINPLPTAPTVNDTLICINNAVILTATAPGGTYEWFDAAIGGTLLFTGASYTTPILTVNDTFWVQTTTLNCTGPRTEVTVTIGNGLIVDAGLDIDICPGDTAILTALPNSTSYTYQWSEPTLGVIDTFINQLLFPLDTTMYTLQVTDTFGCIGFDTVTVNVKPTPVVIVPNDMAYCNGEVVFPSNYSSIPLGASYNWTNSDTAVGLLDQFGIMNTPGFAATNPTTVPIISTISVVPSYLGCTGNPTDYTITVNPIPTLATPPSNTYCIGDVVPPSNINGTPLGVSFSWTNSNPAIGLGTSGLSDVPSFITTNTSTLSITGIIVVTPTANGCIGNPINYSIIVPAPIIIDKKITNATCFGDKDGKIEVFPIGGTPGYTYSWTSGDTDPIASNLSAGPNTVTVTDANNCMQDSTFIVTQRDSIDYIDFNAVPDNGCSPLEVNFTAQINPVLHLIDNYVWNFGNNLLPIDSFNANSIYLDPGSYDVSLTITDTAGCSNTRIKTTFVTVYDDPQAFFNTTPDDPTMFNTTIDFDDASILNIVSWEWAFDTLGFSNLQNPSFTFPEDSGNYLVTLIVEDDNTCRDTITKNIFIRSEIALFFPNSFTPDGDGLNDVFIPKGFGVAIENYSFIVFNRWGEMVFQTNDSKGGWDGFFKGQLSPIGVYLWRAEFRDLNGNNYKRDGHLNLVR